MQHLVQNKTLHPDYQPDLESPIRKISHAALNATPTRRIQALSIPKIPHPEYQPDKPVCIYIYIIIIYINYYVTIVILGDQHHS